MAVLSNPTAFRLLLFGEVMLEREGAKTPLAVPQKALALLGLVVPQASGPQLRAGLASRLWPESTEAQARANLRRHLHLLTKALPHSDALILSKSSVQWDSKRYSADVVEFWRDSADSKTFAEAVSLWNGEFCAGVYDDALVPIREQYGARYTTMLRSLIADSLASDVPSAAIAYLARLVAFDPLDERAARSLIAARHKSGDRAGALRDYKLLMQRLRSEFDVEPEAETVQLFQSILYATVPASVPHNLVPPATSFIGREASLAEVSQALRSHRVVSIVGPGGIGKTRLALQTAFNGLYHYPDGVWFVELADVRGPEGLVERISRAIDAHHNDLDRSKLDNVIKGLDRKQALLILDNCEHIAEDVRAIVDIVTIRTPVTILLTSRRRLRTSDESVHTLTTLEVPPDTSHHRPERIEQYNAVRLFIERAVAVAPSLRITSENARTITEVVRRLDGLPLAIEIAAARTNLLTVEGIAKRLSEHLPIGKTSATRDHRHITLDAMIAWSYDLLSKSEKQVFDSIGVFANGWTLEAIESVAGFHDAFAPLSELIESSLLYTARIDDKEVRYAAFEATRAFAERRLRESGQFDAAALRHAEYYTALAERYAKFFTTPQEESYYAQCDDEFTNLFAALRWATERSPIHAARLISSLWRYWVFGSRIRAIDGILKGLMQADTFDELPTEIRGAVHQTAGMFARERADGPAAEEHLRAALGAYRLSGSRQGEIEVLNGIALVTFNLGRFSEAGELFAECLLLQEAAGDARGAAATLSNLGAIASSLGRFEESRELYERALPEFRATNNLRGVAYALRSLADTFQYLGEMDRAVACARECVAVYERIGERPRLADGLYTLANALLAVGITGEPFVLLTRALEILVDADQRIFLMLAILTLADAAHRVGAHVEAVQGAAKASLLSTSTGHPITKPYQDANDVWLAQARSALGEAEFQAAWLTGSAMEPSDFLDIARRLSTV